jgi:hypothetical protein
MLRKTSLDLTVLLILTCLISSASVGKVEDKYDELYDLERFNTADTNKDGILDKNELRAEQKDFEYYRDNERFKHADTNNDGFLSLDETKAEKQWEKEHYKKLGNEALNDLQKKYPGADFGDGKYLRNHPEVVAELYNNRAWLNNHPNTAKKIAENSKWLANHPQVAGAIYENRHWLVNNPDVATKLYNNKKFLNQHPKFTKWAYKHRKLLQK